MGKCIKLECPGGRIKSVGLGPSLACLFFGGVALALKGLWWPAVESAVFYELVWWSCGHFGIPVVGFLLVLIYHVGIAFWVNKYQIQKLLKQGWHSLMMKISNPGRTMLADINISKVI